MKPRVLILGAGFAGLEAAKRLADKPADVTIIDRQNHHLFQPLLYQVATSGLSATEICQPIRSVFADAPNIRVVMDEVTGIDLDGRTVTARGGSHAFDYLIVALGCRTSWFGNDEWERHAPGLKTIGDALAIRSRLLRAFESAETSLDEPARARLMTIVIVGGGPTGVELAGACAELARHVLRRDFRNIDPRQTRVLLIEAMDRILPQLPARLGQEAARELEQLGVEVRTGTRVRSVDAEGVTLDDGEPIPSGNVVWAAGVQGSPIGRLLGAETDRAGRVKVLDDLSLAGHRNVFVLGDLAVVSTPDGQPVPGVAPAAMQMGRYAGALIAREVTRSEPGDRRAFRYIDKGSMATIGRSAAVAKIGPLEFGGFPAWLAWMFIHLLFLVGFRNKLAVLLQWIYAYFAYRRGARVILPSPAESTPAPRPVG